ncbi:hypothetical protein L1987_42942 [Smallanthus sonchifolius]|uniref:Uncharacterized protein n=1 Tax=Smallanthus sonchifolius TaxID=185202 RepID=A0ACB9GK09_9ASTR|nr:hypothetical protein L1987_42942 [Smallanthus sonchifolius]
MASDQKTIVFDDVAKHNKADDCWLIISGKVYDVTPFIDDHPGGGEVWLRATGKDATIDFGDVGHSDIAKGKMKKYCIGEIDQSTIPVKNSNNTSELIGKVLLVGIMAVVLRILVVYLNWSLVAVLERIYVKHRSSLLGLDCHERYVQLCCNAINDDVEPAKGQSFNGINIRTDLDPETDVSCTPVLLLNGDDGVDKFQIREASDGPTQNHRTKIWFQIREASDGPTLIGVLWFPLVTEKDTLLPSKKATKIKDPEEASDGC